MKATHFTTFLIEGMKLMNGLCMQTFKKTDIFQHVSVMDSFTTNRPQPPTGSDNISTLDLPGKPLYDHC